MLDSSVNRTKHVSFRVTETELELIKQKADEKHMKQSDYIRFIVGNEIFERNTQVGLSEESMDEFREELKAMTQKFTEKLFDLNMLERDLASRTPSIEMSLEDSILMHLNGKKLFLNQIATYCQESPAKTLQALVKLQEQKKVQEDSKNRWYIL